MEEWENGEGRGQQGIPLGGTKTGTTLLLMGIAGVGKRGRDPRLRVLKLQPFFGRPVRGLQRGVYNVSRGRNSAWAMIDDNEDGAVARKRMW